MTAPTTTPASETLATRLTAARTTVLTEVARADTKSGILLTAFSLPLTAFAALVVVLPGRDLPLLADILVGVGAIGLISAMLLVLFVIQPRLSGAARGNFLHWSQCEPEELVEDLLTPTDHVADLIHLSRIARRKFMGLRLAGIVTGTSLVALGAALLAALTA
ncbi:Pycsar system effector family protein [Streptomyces sp. NPDC055607]